VKLERSKKVSPHAPHSKMAWPPREPQREVAEFAEVTEVTVRNRCRELLDNYVIRQKIGWKE